MIRAKPVSTCEQLTSFVCTPFVAAGKALSNLVASVRNAVSGIFSCISNLFSNSKVQDLPNQLSQEQAKIKLLEGRVNQLELENKSLTRERDAAQENLKSTQERLQNTKKTIEDLTARNERLQTERIEAEGEAQQAQATLERVKEELVKTQAQNGVLSSEIAAAKANVTEAEKKLLVARESLTKANKSVAESSKKLDELREEKKRFENLVKEQKSENEKLLEALKQENESLKRDSGLEKSSLITENNKLRNEAKTINEKISTILNENKTFKDQLKKTENKLEDCQKEISSLKGNIEEKEKEIHLVKKTSVESKQEMSRLLQELSPLKEKLLSKNSEIILLTGELQFSKNAAENSKKLLAEEQDKVSRLENELNFEKTRSSASKETLVKKEQELLESKKTLASKEQEINEQQEATKAAQQSLQELRKEVELLKSQIKTEENKLVSAEQKSSESAEQLEQLNKNFEQLKNQLTDKETTLKETQEQLQAARNAADMHLEASKSYQAEVKRLQALLPPAKNEPSVLLAITNEPVVPPSPVTNSPVAASPAVVLSSPPKMSPHASPFIPPVTTTPKSPKEVQKEPGKVSEPAFTLPAPAISSKDIAQVKNAKSVKTNLLARKRELLNLFDDKANLCCNLLALQKLQALNEQIDHVNNLLNEMNEYVEANPGTKQVPDTMKNKLKILKDKGQEFNGKQSKDLKAIQEEMIQGNLPFMIKITSGLIEFNKEKLKGNPLVLRRLNEHLDELKELESSFKAIKGYFEVHSQTNVPSGMLARIKLLRENFIELMEKHNQVFAQIAGPSAPSIESNVADPSNPSTNPEQVLNNLRTLYHSQQALLKGQLKEVQGLIEEMPSLKDAVQKSWQATGRLQSGRNVLGKIRAHEAKLSRMEEHLTTQIDSTVNGSNLEELKNFTSKQTILTTELKNLKKDQEEWRILAEASQTFFDQGAKAREIYLFSRNKKTTFLEKEFAQLVEEAKAALAKDPVKKIEYGIKEEIEYGIKGIEYGTVLRAQKEFLEFKEKLETFALDPEYAEVEFKKFDQKLTDLKAKKVPEEKNESKGLLRSLGSMISFVTG